MRPTILAAALVLLCACGPASVRRTDTIPWPDTSDAEWVALSIGGSPIVTGTRVTMRTSPGGIGGYTGCNWYGLRPDTARPLVEMTARGCRSEIQDQEHRFTTLLPQATSALRRGDTLTLLDSVPSELITFLRRHRVESSSEALIGTSWRMVSATVQAIDPDTVLLRFATDTVVSGFGGCRDFDGSYTARRDNLRFGRIAMRALDCDREQARVAEEHLTTLLSETEHYELRGDTLLLTTFGGDTARLKRIVSSPRD